MLVEDVDLPPGPGNNRAYSWKEIHRLSPADKLRNVNNYVYFDILARIAEFEGGYRLARSRQGAEDGLIELI